MRALIFIVSFILCGAANAGPLEDGKEAYWNDDIEEMVRQFKMASAQSDPEGQNLLGSLYAQGLGVKQDYKEALRLYELSAAQGNLNAQNNIGMLYNLGNGVPVNYSMALKYYKPLAQKGLPVAMNNLGWLYFEGHGVKKNYVTAYMWISLAVEMSEEETAIDNLEAVSAKMSKTQIAKGNSAIEACKNSHFKKC